MFTRSIRCYSTKDPTRKFQESYRLLGLKRKSTPEEIRSSFLKLSKLYHPDNTDTGNQQKFIRIKEAFDNIKHAPLSSANPRPHIDDDDEVDLSHKAYVEQMRRSGEILPTGRTSDMYRSTKQRTGFWGFLGFNSLETEFRGKRNINEENIENDKF